MSECGFQDISDLEDSASTTDDDVDEYNYDYHDDDETDFYTDVRPAKFLPITENGFITESQFTLTNEEVEQLISRDAQNMQTDYQALNQKISQLFNDEISSDIIVQSTDVTFYAHQLILCLWSTAFQVLWQESDKNLASSKDCQKYMLSLKDCPANVTIVGNFLKFMYSGSVTIDFDNIWELVSLADKYQVHDLKDACSRVLVCHIFDFPIDEQLVKLLAPAQTWKMWDLQEAIMSRILQNIYFFSDCLLPVLSIDQLCQVLESSDLVAEDEYKLLLKLMPRLKKLQQSEDHSSVTKILNLVRFTEMSGMQLNEVKQYEIMKPMKLKLNKATFHRCLLWEGQESTVDSRGPRLYLNPPLPYVDIYHGETSPLGIFFSPNDDGAWRYCAQLTIEPDPQWGILPQASIDDKKLYFMPRNNCSSQWIIRNGPEIKHLEFKLQHNKLFVRIKMSKPNRRAEFPGDRKANIIIIVHNESKTCRGPVISTKVSAQIDFHNNAIHFTEPIEFSSGMVVPLSQEVYLTLFVFIPFD